MGSGRSTAGAIVMLVVGFFGVGACQGTNRDFKGKNQAGSGGVSAAGGAMGGKGGVAGGQSARAGASGRDVQIPGDGGSAGESGAAGAGESGAAGNAGSCVPGAKQCQDLQPQKCDASGEWQNTGDPCPVSCSVESGECAGACTSGTSQCNGLKPETCDSSGNWQSQGEPCPIACVGGACVSCTPGAKHCNGLQPQVCDSGGLWKNMGSACSYVCNDATGACQGGCLPGAKQCSALQPQLCDSAGAWQSAGAACGGCTTCSTASGTCVVNTGADCNDGNACTSGETCQASGTCGGGTATTCSNVCITGESCQSDGKCGGGTKASITTSCGNNKFCDGNGACKCRTQSSWNLLTNPGFDINASPWTLTGGATYVSSVDVDGCSGSGSVTLPTLGAIVTRCMPAKPNQTYYFGYRFKASGGPSSAGTAYCYLAFLPVGNTCSVSESTGGGDAAQSYNNDNWIQGSASATSDANTTHVLFTCSSPASSGYHDQFYLSTSSPGVPAF